MKRTISKSERPKSANQIRRLKPWLNQDCPPIHEYLRQADIEKRDPVEILDYMKRFSHSEVVPEMLAWYRSGNLWKVTMASAYFNHSDVPDAIEQLIHQVQSGNAKEAKAARLHLAVYGEIALRKALKLISGPNLQLVVRDIFSRMNGRVIPIVLKSLRKEPLTVRMTIVRALAGRRNHHALPVLLDLVCEEMPVIRTGAPKIDSIAPWERQAARLVLN